MTRRAPLCLLAAAVACVICATTAAESHGVDYRVAAYRSNPSAYESRVLESLNGALDRLLQRGKRWGRRDRSLLQHGPGGWRRPGDALRILLQVWRHRDDPIFLPGACESLAELANDERAVDELEAYLPQLAYMILGLPADSLLSSVLERFALRLCESNAHWALQLSWTVYAALEDNRPGGSLGGDSEAYSRAARLLQLIEQSVVYGAKMVNRDTLRSSALAHNIQLWRSRVVAEVHVAAAKVHLCSHSQLPSPLPSRLIHRCTWRPPRCSSSPRRWWPRRRMSWAPAAAAAAMAAAAAARCPRPSLRHRSRVAAACSARHEACLSPRRLPRRSTWRREAGPSLRLAPPP